VHYGYALALSEVRRISPHRYEEVLVDVIDPATCGGLLGIHTINRSSRYEVIDGLQRRPRPPRL
jgi:hypothetical protein